MTVDGSLSEAITQSVIKYRAQHIVGWAIGILLISFAGFRLCLNLRNGKFAYYSGERSSVVSLRGITACASWPIREYRLTP